MIIKQSNANLNMFLTVLLATISGSIFLEIFFLLLQSAYNESAGHVPWSLHWIWELIALGVIAYFSKKHLGLYAGYLIQSYWIITTISFIFYFIFPHTFSLISNNYYGIESINNSDKELDYMTNYLNRIDYPLKPGYLYLANDINIRTLLDPNSKSNEFVSAKGFIFWQTGIASGFDPIRIKEYKSESSFYNFIELFVSVGPITILECTIKGIAKYFTLWVVVQFIFYFFTGKHLWWYTPEALKKEF